MKYKVKFEVGKKGEGWGFCAGEAVLKTLVEAEVLSMALKNAGHKAGIVRK